MDTATQMANAFSAEASGTTPVVNVSGVDAPAATGQVTNRFYTEEDLQRVRSQEKDKLYPQIEELKGKVNLLEKEREETVAQKAAREAELAAAKEAEQRAKEANELDAKSYADKRTQELQEQLERERQERERAFALLEKERSFADLQAYRQQALAAEADNIMPQLVKYVHGNTREEIDAAIADVKAETASILQDAGAAIQNARQSMQGTRITTPPAGPLETNSEQRMPTADELAAMPMNEYAKYRERALSESARGISRGMFGSR